MAHTRSIAVTLVSLAFFAGAGIASAATVNFVAPTLWTRGSTAFSTYQQWDVFPTTAGPNAPNSPGQIINVNGNGVVASVAATPFNSYGTADTHETSGNGLLSSGGNIYSPFASIDLDVTVPTYSAGGPGGWTTILLQTRSLGTVLNLNSVNIVHNAQTFLPVDSAQLFVETQNTPFGVSTNEERWFEFHLPGSAANYTINFAASGSSMSLDNLAVDTFWTPAASAANEPTPVPEPAAWLLVSVGAAGVTALRRVRTGPTLG